MEGAKVYIPDDKTCWHRAVVVAAIGGGRFRVQKETWEDEGEAAGDVVEVDASKLEGGSLPFQNSNMPNNGFPNMTTLDHLHEAALLHNLRRRFFAGACPYTYTAEIVIAVNPYRWYPELYTEEMRKEYLVFDRTKLAPHAYATSSQAYSGLQETRVDQAILVSGESGAGKTETVKILMGHLALIASTENSTHIKRIVESNPLLESFGNAQTVRNDNSSRFGKFIELEMDGACRLVGSRCRTYLLEKSRVVTQDAGERNYHIFYQMLAASQERRATIGLGSNSCTRSEMRYTRMGASPIDTIEGKSDAERFDLTVAALAIVGVEGESLSQLLHGLAGVLLMGQIEFDPSNDDGSAVKAGSIDDAANVASVLSVDPTELGAALTTRTIRTGKEEFVKPLSPESALAARDALAKELYSRIFDWLVARICAATTAGTAGDVKHFVGMLDIFGFESFAINRFEQLCINYANEKLQQKFTLDVFKSVQQEYADEGIPWDKIEFKDNAPVLALIEAKIGVIAMLNEECVRPKGADDIFVSKLVSVHKADPAFSVPKLGKMKEFQFTITHYAGHVTYTTTGWLERNKDTLSENINMLMCRSANPLVAAVFEGGKETIELQGKAKGGAEFVATKFKNSLAQLMETIGKTQTQYVRCIKPNKNKSAAEVDNAMVVDQLRCAGVIEAIRISRAGFPARMPLKDCALRFVVLARAAAGQLGTRLTKYVTGAKEKGSKITAVLDAISRKVGDNELCRALMFALIDSEDRYQIGRTRVYFKSGVLEGLEERRSLLMQGAATELSRCIRGRLAHKRFQLARQAALKLQSNYRMRLHRKTYIRIRCAILRCQSLRRTTLARRCVRELRQKRAATRLQSCWLRHQALQKFNSTRKAAIRLQSVMRQRICRRQYLKDLVEHKEQAKLENQVKALQAKLAAREKEFTDRVAAGDPGSPVVVSAEPSAELSEALQALAVENAKLRVELHNVKTENAALRRENQELKASQSTRTDYLSFMRGNKNKQVAEANLRRPSSGIAMTPTAVDQEEVPNFQLDHHSSDHRTSQSSNSNVNGASLQHCSPLSDFYEDVPCDGIPVLRSTSEVHIKLGYNILMLDDQKKYLKWHPMEASKGYSNFMNFAIERRAERRSGAPRASLFGLVSKPADDKETLGPGDEGCIGLNFALRSVVTNKYVAKAGMNLPGFSSCFQVTASSEDAQTFTIVPMSGSDASAMVVHDTGPAAYCFAMRLQGDNKALSLRKDGYVHTSNVTDDDKGIDCETMACSLEYMAPSVTYELTIDDTQIGITVGKDLPLSVVGFKNVNVDGAQVVGPAERTGRVRIGDIITQVNGQDIQDMPRKDVLSMIANSRPVTLSFSANH